MRLENTLMARMLESVLTCSSPKGEEGSKGLQPEVPAGKFLSKTGSHLFPGNSASPAGLVWSSHCCSKWYKMWLVRPWAHLCPVSHTSLSCTTVLSSLLMSFRSLLEWVLPLNPFPFSTVWAYDLLFAKSSFWELESSPCLSFTSL